MAIGDGGGLGDLISLTFGVMKKDAQKTQILGIFGISDFGDYTP